MPEIQSKDSKIENLGKVFKAILTHRNAMRQSLARYMGYGDRWEKTAFFPSGGFLVTSKSRLEEASKNKQEAVKYAKEKDMCLQYASFGFKIEHLGEVSGISSSDTRIAGHVRKKVVKVNGMYADLKSTSSTNNIEKYAKKAIYKQRAQLVLFEFTKKSSKMITELGKLSEKGYHGFYYFKGENEYGRF